MDIIPETGAHLTQLLLPVSQSVAAENPHILSSTFSFSDSIHLYIQTALLGIISIGIIFGLTRLNKTNHLLFWIRSAVSIILAFFLLKYGLEKWTRLQFPLPPPNILHAETGSLDKDILFWSLMGTSKAYAGFMGFIEILASILLLIPRTRLIGGYIAAGIFTNILALNIGFDISVKLLSFALLCSAIFIISPSIVPLLRLLSNQKVQAIEKDEIAINPILKRAIKGFAVTLILLECGLPLFRLENLEFNPETIDQQTFEIVQLERNPEGIPNANYRRIHFHSGGFMIMETKDGNFESHPIRLPKGANSFKLINNNTTVYAMKRGNDWIFAKGKQLLWRCKRVPNEELPLLKDDFHWTVEGMIPE